MFRILKLGSALRRQVLAYFLANADAAPYVRELARIIEVDPTNLSRELARLAEQGILAIERRGNLKHFRLDRKYPFYRELRKMLQSQLGPVPQLRAALGGLKGVEQAFIYGSFAKGTETGTSDIDLLLIGKESALNLEGHLRPVEGHLGREINYTLISRRELQERLRNKDPFFVDVWKGPKQMVLP